MGTVRPEEASRHAGVASLGVYMNSPPKKKVTVSPSAMFDIFLRIDIAVTATFNIFWNAAEITDICSNFS
ncbi:hypothetical protein NLL20_27450, partial [Klebsiella quasipneumoniae]|nr:hypothetical protein [Klebsiella quasipneumoniae]